MYLPPKPLIVAFALFLASIASSLATITLDLQAEILNTSDGPGSPAPTSTLVLVLADTAGDGFGPFNAGNIIAGSLVNADDVIVYRVDLSSLSAGVLFDSTPGLTLGDTNAGTTTGVWRPTNPLAIVWLPTLTMTSNTAVAGTPFGQITNGTPAANTPASSPFITPADGTGDYKLYYFSNEAGATNLTGMVGPGAPLSASLTVIPEPSAAALLSFALIGVCLRRRR